MSAKVTAIAPSNIAFIKYWGVRDAERTIPCNRSISMTLERCRTRTTVEYVDGPGADEILLRDGTGELTRPAPRFVERAAAHLRRIREDAGCDGHFRMATENSFPADAGLASSASGFAALSLAASAALGTRLEARPLSDLCRRSGSGSAARSALGGFVEWPAGFDDAEGHAVALAAADHWPLCDVIALVDRGEKPTASLEGHALARTSPHFETRQRLLEPRLDAVRRAIAARDLERLGPIVEEDAIELHLIAMSSCPPVFYWAPETLSVLSAVRALRREGISAWATMDAGPNVHVICGPGDADAVARGLGRTPGVREVIRDAVGPGPRLVDDHLF